MLIFLNVKYLMFTFNVNIFSHEKTLEKSFYNMKLI